jgi:hypothetical protein
MMQQPDPSIDLRLRLVERLTQAARALADEGTSCRDALAVTRNIAAAVLAEVEIMGESPALVPNAGA